MAGFPLNGGEQHGLAIIYGRNVCGICVCRAGGKGYWMPI